VTVPLALLQKNAIQFNPPLSEKKVKAINSLGAGVIEKVSNFRLISFSFHRNIACFVPVAFAVYFSGFIMHLVLLVYSSPEELNAKSGITCISLS